MPATVDVHVSLPATLRRRHQWATTAFLRVPRSDFPLLVAGEKRELRVMSRGRIEPPSPIIIYCRAGVGPELSETVVCEAWWQEPLGSISLRSLQHEGFCTCGGVNNCSCKARGRFRDYWRGRDRKWDPLMPVIVYRLRPWADGDLEFFGQQLVERLYFHSE